MRIRNLASHRLWAAVLFCGVAWGAAQQSVTREFQKTAPLGASQRLLVENKFGSTKVMGESRSDVSVKVIIKAAHQDRAEAEKLLGTINVFVEPGPDGLRVRTEYTKLEGEKNVSRSVSLEILMPKSNPLEVASQFGPVTVDGTGAGTKVVAKFGPARVSNAAGNIDVENAFGPVTLEHINGPVKVANDHGPVRVQLDGTMCQAITIRNSFGPVRVDVAGGASYDVTGTTTFGPVRSDFGLKASGTNQEAEISGRVGNGGCPLAVTNKFGPIDIKKLQ